MSTTMSLGLGILIAESEDGAYEPIGVVGSVDEAREVAASDKKGRIRELKKGNSPMFVYCYKVWANRTEGYVVVAEIPA